MDAALVKLMGEGVATQGKEGGKVASGGESEFKKVLEQQLSQAHDSTQMAQQILGHGAGGPRFGVMSVSEIKVDPSQIRGGRPSNVVEMLGEVNRSALQLDQMIEMAMSGQSFTPQELLAMQAGAYRIIEEVNLTGQIVSSADRARNSLLNIQV